MKLNIDIGYILKRLIVIILAFIIISQLKSCDVFAASYDISPSNCYGYFGTSNSSGTPTDSTENGGVHTYYCNNLPNHVYTSSRFDFTFSPNLNGYGTIGFTAKYIANISTAIIITGGTQYNCDVSTGIVIGETSGSGTIGAYMYSVTCPNVPISQNRTYSVYLYHYKSTGLPEGPNIVSLSKQFVFSLNDSSTISQSIDQQAQQQHEDSQAQIDSQKVCTTKIINNTNIVELNKALLGDGTTTTVNDDRGVTDYIDISKFTDILNIVPNVTNNNYFCTYTANKTKINCYNMSQYNDNSFTISSSEKYARFTIIQSTNIPQFELSVCQNGNQAMSESLNDSSTSSSNSSASSIFAVDENGQSTNTNIRSFGLSGVITAPLNILNRAKEKCTPKSFVMFQKTITLPCGDDLFWNRDFSSQASIFDKGQTGSGLNTTRNTFRIIWNVLFGGAIMYHLLIKLWEVIQDALNPNNDRYESIGSAIDTGDDYVPRHSKEGYSPKHTADGKQSRSAVLGGAS